MADDKSKKEGRSRSKVAGKESNELSSLEQKLGANREQIKLAIQAVGNDRKKVEAFLKKAK